MSVCPGLIKVWVGVFRPLSQRPSPSVLGSSLENLEKDFLLLDGM